MLHKINLPTVMKTTILPGDSMERLFIATQLGEILYIGNGAIRTFLDIRPRVIKLGASSGGYDERGLLGLAFHPSFYYNGLFYLHYSVAGTQGPGALPEDFKPDPCDPIMDSEMEFNNFLNQIYTILNGRKSYDLWGQFTPEAIDDT
jgi:hypothetical protein